MLRFTGEELPEQPKVAVVANDAIGNFVVTTPLLQALKTRYPTSELSYFGGWRTWELQLASKLADHSFPLHGCSTKDYRHLLRKSGEFDLIFNCESTAFSKTTVGLLAGENTYVAGPCMNVGGRGDLPYQDDERGALWRDREWIAPDLTSRYPFLQSGFIGEIFCRLAYLDGPVPGYSVPWKTPPILTRSVLIAMSASLPEKLWPVEKWIELCQVLASRKTGVGLLGAAPASQGRFWKGASDEDLLLSSVAEVVDFRGKLTLPEVVGALGSATRCITLDNGILHLAVAAGTPTVGLYRHGIHRLWAPPSDRLKVLTAGEGRVVADIEVDEVIAAMDRED